MLHAEWLLKMSNHGKTFPQQRMFFTQPLKAVRL